MRRHIGIMFGHGLAIALMVGFLIGFSPVIFISGQAFADGSDNFDDSTIDLTKWAGYDPSEKKGQGQINQVNGHLEYTTSGNGTSKDSYDHKWIATQFPYNANLVD